MSDDSQRHGAIGVVLDEQSRFLVIRRSQTVRAPGRLCFPGGSVEPGETQEAAVVRELKEELAIFVTPVRKVWENFTPSGTRLHWWLVDMLAGEIPTPDLDEVAEFFWMSGETLAKEADTLQTNLDFLFELDQGNIKL